MGAFVISWLPFFLVYTFDPFFKFELSDFTNMIFTWLGYINSSIVSIPFAITDCQSALEHSANFMSFL